jgi:hypothetical protein
MATQARGMFVPPAKALSCAAGLRLGFIPQPAPAFDGPVLVAAAVALSSTF